MGRELQSSSYLGPNGLRADSPRSPGRGMGKGKGEAVSLARERFDAAVAWAKKNVPDQHPAFAASTALTIRALQKRWPSPDEVRERLKAQGRDQASLDALEKA